jgi:hypothetical protein
LSYCSARLDNFYQQNISLLVLKILQIAILVPMVHHLLLFRHAEEDIANADCQRLHLTLRINVREEKQFISGIFEWKT